MQHLRAQFPFGSIALVVGWAFVHAYGAYKTRDQGNAKGKTPYNFGIEQLVPLAVFLLAQTLHGYVFLAAFVAGLLASYNHADGKFQLTLQVMEVKVESIAKPIIFMMVGPFISINELAATAWLGLVVSVAFIVFARPAAVTGTMLPPNFSLRERGFLCSIRETGVIPVVLAVITTAQFPQPPY